MNRTEIPLSKTKIVVLLIGALAFVVLGIVFVLTPETFLRAHQNNTFKIVAIGVAAILFFGLAGIFAFRKLLDKRPGLILDENGIDDNTSGASLGIIKWEDITGIETKEIHSNKILLIHVSNPDDYINRTTGLKRRLMQTNYNMYGTPLSITANTLKCDFKVLEQMLLRYIKI